MERHRNNSRQQRRRRQGITVHNWIFLLLGIAIGSLLVGVSLLPSNYYYPYSSSPTLDSTTSSTYNEGRRQRDTMNVVVGIHLDGRKDQTGFMDEWEVHLKSLLIHSPMEYNLHIHIICNGIALSSIKRRIENNNLTTFYFRNKVTLTCYVVDRYESKWEEYIYTKTNHAPLDSAKKVYTIGSYYRVLADQVLPDHLVNVIYCDTDVVFNSNLNPLYPLLDPITHNEWCQMGRTFCSGFMIINLKVFPSYFWTAIDKLAAKNINFAGVHDQYLLRLVRENSDHHDNANTTTTGSSIGILPDEWNIHYSDHIHDLGKVAEKEAAYLHFNGIRNQQRGFWEDDYGFVCRMDLSRECPVDSTNETTRRRFQQSWPIADYYVNIRWIWVKHMVRSLIRSEADDDDGSGGGGSANGGEQFSFQIVDDP